MNRLRFLMFVTKLLPLTILLVAVAASADLSSKHKLQHQGTVTQGFIYTSNNNFAGPSDDRISLEFTELSLNGSYNFAANIRMAGQALYRKSGDVTDSIEVDYLFIDYQALANAHSALGTRLGRVKIPLGLYNDARDIAYTRPSILLPQSIYPDTFRDLTLSANGVLLYNHVFTDAGQWSFEIGAGDPRVEDFNDFPLNEVNDEQAYFGRIAFENSDGAWKFSLSALGGHLDFDFDIGTLLGVPEQSPLSIGAEQNLYILSLQHNFGDWTVTGEYQRKEMDLDIPTLYVPSPFGQIPLDLDIDELGEAYFIQLERRITTDITGLIRWDRDYSDREDRSGKIYSARFNTPAYDRYAKDITVGVRWNITNKTLFNFEYHNIKGTSWISLIDNSEGPGHKNWSIVAATISFRY